MAEAEVEAPRVEPLRCPSCNAAVPLADEDVVACPYCKTQVPVPAEHRDALRAARQADASRATARTLYHELGRRPRRSLRVAAFVFGTWKRILLFYLLISAFVLLLEVVATFAVGALLRNNLFETSSGGHMLDVILLPVWIGGLLLITAFGVYGKRTALDRQKLQVALSAAPAAHPGGPATWREGGGALLVGPGDLGARCVYCGTDNLVAVPPEWLAAFKGRAHRARREIEEVERTAAVERRKRRRSLVGHLALMSAILGAFLAQAMCASSHEKHGLERFPPQWTLYLDDPRPVLRREAGDKMTRIAMPPGCAAAAAVAPDDCAGGRCTARLHVALRHGERVRLHNLGSAPLGMAVEWHYFAGWPQDRTEEFGHTIAAATVAPGATADATADWSAWYQVLVTAPGPGGPVPLCLEVAR